MGESLKSDYLSLEGEEYEWRKREAIDLIIWFSFGFRWNEILVRYTNGMSENLNWVSFRL